MESSEGQDDPGHDPGLSEAPTGAPVPSEDEATDVSETEEATQQDEVNESHPNEGDIEEAVQDVDVSDSPEDVNDASDGGSGEEA